MYLSCMDSGPQISSTSLLSSSPRPPSPSRVHQCAHVCSAVPTTRGYTTHCTVVNRDMYSPAVTHYYHTGYESLRTPNHTWYEPSNTTPRVVLHAVLQGGYREPPWVTLKFFWWNAKNNLYERWRHVFAKLLTPTTRTNKPVRCKVGARFFTVCSQIQSSNGRPRVEPCVRPEIRLAMLKQC